MPGLLLSGTVGVVPALGIGAEASAVRVTKSPLTTFGVFGQAQSYAGEYGRYAGGVEMGWGFGAELGYDFREAHNEFAGTHGVHVAAFASLGFASLALRSTVPVAKGNSLGRNQGFEMGLALTIKIPVGNYSEDLPFSIGHGRPPRRGQTAFRGRSGGYAAQLWQERATHELASVATFVALAHDLAMHGAPLALTARALHAAQDEWAHAMGAARVAAAMGGNATFQASSFAQTGASVDVLVREAVTDGMVGEGAAAHALWAAAEDHGAGALRDELARVGGQERRHATLAHDVVGWALRTYPRAGLDAVAQRALAQAARELPTSHTERRLRASRSAARSAGLHPLAHGARAARQATDRAERALHALCRRT
jgi:hypothetical protein